MLPRRPEWMGQAYCAQRRIPTDVFYPVGDDARGHGIRTAKAICRQCPVALECLAWALEHHEAGVWGGTTQTERRYLPRRGGVA